MVMPVEVLDPVANDADFRLSGQQPADPDEAIRGMNVRIGKDD
jgi:hypothetical protein